MTSNSTDSTVLVTENAQQRFDRTYITGAEIMQELNLSRSALLYARNTGKLPDAIELNHGNLYIWERETIQPYLSAWKMVLNARRRT